MGGGDTASCLSSLLPRGGGLPASYQYILAYACCLASLGGGRNSSICLLLAGCLQRERENWGRGAWKGGERGEDLKCCLQENTIAQRRRGSRGGGEPQEEEHSASYASISLEHGAKCSGRSIGEEEEEVGSLYMFSWVPALSLNIR